MSERIPEVVCERININESEVLVFSVKNGLSMINTVFILTMSR